MVAFEFKGIYKPIQRSRVAFEHRLERGSVGVFSAKKPGRRIMQEVRGGTSDVDSLNAAALGSSKTDSPNETVGRCRVAPMLP